MKRFCLAPLGAMCALCLADNAGAAPSSLPEADVINLAARAEIEIPGRGRTADFDSTEFLADGVKGVDGKGEWVTHCNMAWFGRIAYPEIKLTWKRPVTMGKVVFHDRPRLDQHIGGGHLYFSDGSMVSVFGIPNDGSPRAFSFPPKEVEWMRFKVFDGVGSELGLSELEVFERGDPESMLHYRKTTEPVEGDWVSWVDPLIETTRDRWLFCAPGSLPFGMVAAAPYTRNKNQGGGGYNYNSTEILGFGQLHGWIMSGIDFLPTTGNVDFTQGTEERKSPFSHDDEIVQPGYQSVYLQKYRTRVELTCTDRVSLYRMTYDQASTADLMISLGGWLGSVSMVGADLKRVSATRVEGKVGTTDRMWGGPALTWIFFVIDFDRPFDTLNGWKGLQKLSDVSSLSMPIPAGRIVNQSRTEYMFKTLPEEQAGIAAHYRVEAGDRLQMKIGVSFTSIANARNNLEQECPGWDFDAVRKAAQGEWNRWLGRIEVQGGTREQKIKFYTDLWHALLGRHKIDDLSGDYPCYMDGKRSRSNAELRVRRVPMAPDGKRLHHMYNSDALWLTMWNLNILWGLAWPEVLDEFSASWMEYARAGGMLPRGPCCGAYTSIMAGCPATSLMTSAYQKGLMRKIDPVSAFEQMKKDHHQDGMQECSRFYEEHGWDPERPGAVVQWAFEDWALAQMAADLGKMEDYQHFVGRSRGWINSFSPEHGLLMAKDEDGKLASADPCSGKGWVEANAWTGTFSVAHGLEKLAELMGGKDKLAEKVNFALEQSKPDRFFSRGGYVCYANQPGCSTAHVLNYAGRPWLAQYWVRCVSEAVYGGADPGMGYGGYDEDQGQMSGVSALMKLGLFSQRGTCSREPVYEITAPIFDEIVIALDPKYYSGKQFAIRVHDNSRENVYIQKATLKGKPLTACWFYHKDFVRGGVLELWLGPKPNTKWGAGPAPPLPDSPAQR